MRMFISSVVLLLAFSVLHAADGDPAKAALDTARKAAKDAGVELPDVKQEDIDKLVGKLAEEVRKAQQKNAEKDEGTSTVKPGSDPDAPTIRIEKLPDWVPAIAGFKPLGPGKQWQGVVATGKLKGSSAESPAALAKAWTALEGKGFAAEHTTRTAAGVTRETVRLTKSGTKDIWVEMQAEPGKDSEPTAVRVTYAQPGEAVVAPKAKEKNGAAE